MSLSSVGTLLTEALLKWRSSALTGSPSVIFPKPGGATLPFSCTDPLKFLFVEANLWTTDHNSSAPVSPTCHSPSLASGHNPEHSWYIHESKQSLSLCRLGTSTSLAESTPQHQVKFSVIAAQPGRQAPLFPSTCTVPVQPPSTRPALWPLEEARTSGRWPSTTHKLPSGATGQNWPKEDKATVVQNSVGR